MYKKQLETLRIYEGESIKAAMKQMDSAGLKILFVVDKASRLLGTLTDGDFRRWILAGKSFDADIKNLFHRNPIKFLEDYDIEEIKRLMVGLRLESIPIVDKNQKIVDALFWEDIFGNKYKKIEKKLNIPVAIVAGGEGTRLSPLTKILPKSLMPIGDKPVAEVIMDNFAEFGCDKFYLLLGYKGDMVKIYFDTSGTYKPTYVVENEPSGTAGALRYLNPDLIEDALFVSNCDTIIKADYADLYDFHKKGDYDITIVGAMRHFVIPYGVVEMETEGNISKLVEKPEYDFLVNTGMYLINKKVLAHIPQKGKFDFTDLLKKVKEKGGKIKVYPVSEKSWIDVGQLELLKEATSDSGPSTARELLMSRMRKVKPS